MWSRIRSSPRTKLDSTFHLLLSTSTSLFRTPPIFAISWHQSAHLNPCICRWEDADYVMKTEDGSQGVLFVHIKGQGALVLKSSMGLAGEVFATVVARQMDIPGPQMRVIQMSGSEGKRIKTTIKSLTRNIGIR